MGTVIGAIATASIPADGSHASLHAWTSPTSLLAGFVLVAACGYLAAVYLTGEAAHRGDRRMRTYFARRAQAAAILAGGLSLALLAELHNSNRALYDRLTGRALPLVILAGLCGLAVLALLSAHWVRILEVRVLAALGVAAVIWGWGVAQYPVLLPGTTVTLYNAGAPEVLGTLVALVVIFVFAVLVVGPSFALLFSPQSRGALGGDEGGLLAGADPGNHGQTPRPTPPP